MLRSFFFCGALMLASLAGLSQTTENSEANPKWDYQIYLKQPAKEIKEISYTSTCNPVSGRLSEDRKTIIVKNYQQKSCIYVKVIYQDGSEDEFIRSSCFIDPVVI